MPTWSRAVHTSLGVAALVALAQPGAVAPPQSSDLAGPALSASSTPAPAPAPAATPAPPSTPTAPVSGGMRKISYHGVGLDVPAAWPVVDLQADPHACVRLDRQAVYLGDPTGQQDCPAHLVGHADTVWLHGTRPFDRPAPAARAIRRGGLVAQVVSDPTGQAKQVHFPHQNVQLDASWGNTSAAVDAVLASASPTTSPTTTGPATGVTTTTRSPTPTASAAYGAAAPDLSSAALTATTTTVSSTFNGMAFDACSAPTTTTMQRWLASPYRTLGIYIGGATRACPDGNLSSSWVSAVKSMGWGLVPIYVGLQAPCNNAGIKPFVASQAAAQGKISADDAAQRAAFFGLAAGTPIYYDMEAYNTTVSGCSQAVMTFISAWSKEMAALGYASGAYGSTSSLMNDMSKAMGTTGFVPPKDIWFADWNGLQTTTSSYFSSAYWSNHQRLHQYSGDISQTWGGVNLNIDANWSDAQVAGVAVPVSYGTNVVGPGSTGFVFTGDMTWWRPNAPQGLKGMSYWTHPSGGLEANGATWSSPRLTAGLYNVQAYIPRTAATATAPYTVRYAGGSTVKMVNQQPFSGGSTSLGTYLATAGSSMSVHVGDNDASSTTTQLGVDAMAFQLVATAPGAPTGVTATGGNTKATVSWGAAAANGRPVTSYTVRANPGGASVTVPGTSTSTAVTGLTNGTAYTFTVTATNAVGPGPGATSNGVTPSTPPHDWNSDTHNDVLARDQWGTLWLYPGNGTGGWMARSKVGAGWSGYTIATPGDLDGDAHPDVLGLDGAGNLWLYPGNGMGGWFPRRQVGSGWQDMTAVVAPGDFNGDGHPDVLARDRWGTLWLYPGNGSGGWLTRSKVGAGWNGYTIVTPGDFNGDGHPDVLARDGSGNLWLYPGNGTGGWLPRTQVGWAWGGFVSITSVGDFDGDGHPDVLAQDGSGNLWLYPSDGTGGWLPRRQVGRGWTVMTAVL